VDTVYNYYISI